MRLSDLVTALMIDCRMGKAKHEYILKVLEELVHGQDETHIERTIQAICDYEQIEIIFLVVDRIANANKDPEKRALMELILVLVFNEALSRQWTHVGMRIMKAYEEVILRNDKRVLPSLLQSLVESPFLMDLKLSMIKLFLPRIQFQYVDIMITNLA